MLYVAFAVSILLFFLILEIKNAPNGYEDENGFHKEKK